MAKIQDILEIHRNIAESLGQRMNDFENKLKSSSPSSDTSKPSLEKLHSEFNEFKTSVWNILGLLKSLIHNVVAQVDDIDNQTRRNALLFNGIEEKEGENLISIILSTVQVLMGLSDVQPSAIQQCHRLGSQSDRRARPILVRFNDLTVRNLIFNNEKALKTSPVVLSEFLTKTRHDLLIFGLTNCWTRYGALFIKLPNNERQRIADLEHLEDLMAKHPIISSPTTSGSIANLSKIELTVQQQRKVTPASSSRLNTRPVTRKQMVKKV